MHPFRVHRVGDSSTAGLDRHQHSSPHCGRPQAQHWQWKCSAQRFALRGGEVVSQEGSNSEMCAQCYVVNTCTHTPSGVLYLVVCSLALRSPMSIKCIYLRHALAFQYVHKATTVPVHECMVKGCSLP